MIERKKICESGKGKFIPDAVMAFITDRNYQFSLPQNIRFPLNEFELATKVIVGLYFSNGKISYNIYMY